MERRAKREELRRKEKAKTNALLCFCVILFVLLSALLVMQRNLVNNMDARITELNSEYDMLLKVNDDLQGKLMSARNLSSVEAYASGQLGMVPSSASHISYVSYSPQSAVASSDGVVATAETFASWISGWFK